MANDAAPIAQRLAGIHMKRKFTASLWREGKWYIAQCLEVDVASQSRSEKTALKALGDARLRAAAKGWAAAQDQFAAAFGRQRTTDLRALLRAVAVTALPAA